MQMVSTPVYSSTSGTRPSPPRAFCCCSVLENRGDDHLPVVAIDTVTGTLQRQQPGTGDFYGQNLAMLAREHRVGDAVDDERRGSDRRQGLRRSFAVGHEVMVLHRGEVARPLNVAADELTHSGPSNARSPPARMRE